MIHINIHLLLTVPCPPGMYMVSSQCAPCPGGYYQSLPGQTACQLCPDNKIVVDGGTNCTGITLRIY